MVQLITTLTVVLVTIILTVFTLQAGADISITNLSDYFLQKAHSVSCQKANASMTGKEKDAIYSCTTTQLDVIYDTWDKLKKSGKAKSTQRFQNKYKLITEHVGEERIHYKAIYDATLGQKPLEDLTAQELKEYRQAGTRWLNVLHDSNLELIRIINEEILLQMEEKQNKTNKTPKPTQKQHYDEE